MKLLAGIVLFCLCALAGEERARRLQRREQRLARVTEVSVGSGDRQMDAVGSSREGALLCPPSPEREELLKLSGGGESDMPLLTGEEKARLAAYARSDSRSVAALRSEREALLALLQQDGTRTREELTHKGQVCRSVGYLCGVAALLLVL